MHKRRQLGLMMMLCCLGLPLMAGCASLGIHSSDSFDKRLTSAQNYWRYSGTYYRGEEVPAPVMSAEGKIQNILDRLVYVSPLRGYDIRVRVIDDSGLGASTDGTSVYVSKGFLQAAWKDESMMAGVMAHELGHIIGNHAQNRSPNPGLLLQVISPALSTTKFGAVGAFVLREAVTIGQKAYSRKDEMEADAIAAILTQEAGYDPYGLTRFFEMAAQAGCGSHLTLTVPVVNYTNPQAAAQGAALSVLRMTPLYDSHPPGPERMQTIDWIVRTKQGIVPLDALRAHSRALAELFSSIEARRPKTRPRSENSSS